MTRHILLLLRKWTGHAGSILFGSQIGEETLSFTPSVTLSQLFASGQVQQVPVDLWSNKSLASREPEAQYDQKHSE